MELAIQLCLREKYERLALKMSYDNGPDSDGKNHSPNNPSVTSDQYVINNPYKLATEHAHPLDSKLNQFISMVKIVSKLN